MAEPWVTITAAKAKTRLGEREYAAATTGALVTGAESPLDQALRTAVGKVWGFVRSCEQNTIGPAGTVPPELEAECLMLVVEDLATRLPAGGLIIDEQRKERIDRAYRMLRDVAHCDFLITQPEVPSVTSPVSSVGAYGGEVRMNFNPYATVDDS